VSEGSSPLVSVIMPTYRRPALLRRSILSVLAQTYSNFELIVVDDCSPDETPEVVKAFTDPRLRYIRRTQNGRAALARNDGIAAARGSFIAFQDDDDIWLPHKLERQVAALLAAPPEVGLVLCSYLRMYPGRMRYIGHDYHFKRLDYSRGNPMQIDYGLIATPAWLVRREVLDRAGGFDARMRSWDDWELGLRVWRQCKFQLLDEPLFIQDHVQGSAMMRDEAAFRGDMRVILEKHGALWEGKRILQSKHYYVIGRGECQFGTVEAGRPWLWRAVRANPLHLWAWATLAVSLLGTDGVRGAVQLSRALLGGPRRSLRRVRQMLSGQ
jgi:glycosyltransferase involved in cell wall biosynthesis